MSAARVPLIPSVQEIQWRIPNYDLLLEEDANYFSTPFSFGGTSWYVNIYPNGQTKKDSVGYIDIYLHRQSEHGAPICVDFTFGLIDEDGDKRREKYGSHNFDEVIGHGFSKWIKRDSILDKTYLFPSNTLTVFCTLKYSAVTTDEHRIVDCSYCEKPLNAEIIPLHEKKCMERPIKCPECLEVVLLQYWRDHACQNSIEGNGSLHQDLKKVLLDGLNHDLILKVGNKELKAHRDILRARSEVFESMLNHDMKERNNGVIDIPDCDPQAMKQFLSYMYTGKFETTEYNMLKLYYIADKYSVKGLQEECCVFIKKSLSSTNICDVIQTALKHTNSSLLEYATEYFTNNALDVMGTIEWQYFMKDNSTVANELIIKSFKKLKYEFKSEELRGLA